MKKFLFITILIPIIISCSPVKKVLNAGRLKQTEFIEKIPFNFDTGVPIVEVNIAGKTYHFLLDTGAPTAISPALAQTLNLNAATNSRSSDSQGYQKKEIVVVIPEIKIGKLLFENTGALIVDTKKVFQMKCLNVDGIIGANQMAKAIWQLDYANKVASITNNMTNLDTAAGTKTIGFSPVKIQKTPLIQVRIGSKTSMVTFDTGSNGSLDLSLLKYADLIKNFKQVNSTGIGGIGIYGAAKPSTTIYAKIPDVSIGTFGLKNQIIMFADGKSSNIGNDFLQHYKVIINWQTNKIYLTGENHYNLSKLNRFGIAITYSENKAFVSSIFNNTDAAISGIQVNDEIVQIDSHIIANFSEKDACNFTFNHILKGKDSANVTISRAGKKIAYKLKRSILLE